MNEANLTIPPKLIPVFTQKARYRIAKGGRGSAKTRTFALMTAVRGYQWGMEGKTGQILCGREFMNSLEDSSLEEVKAAIRSVPWLLDYYELGDRYIKSKDGAISYTFAGLRRSLDSLKSKARILVAWIDEAETVSETAWRKLIPTVREDNSEIWVTYNPESKESATHKRFVEQTPDDSILVDMNWRDNPWFPDVLETERLEDQRKRPDIYDHVWEGDFLIHAEGAYYATEMRNCKDQGRVGTVAYDPSVSVTTAWDLGIGDSTAIWFAQHVGAEVRLIDFYESSGVGLDHYVRVLNEKGYVYGNHILPHDVRVRELGSGKSRLEVLDSLGARPVSIAPSLMVDDGIQAVRSMLANCWFDAEKCDRGVHALRQYHREYDDNGKVWRSRPAHDWASHASDAFRYLAIGYRVTSGWGNPIRRNLKGIV
jgi:phage terminase large subunit